MTVLVTGATGFLGRHLVDLLVGRGEPVRILAQPAEDTTWLEQKGVKVHRGDITDYLSLEKAVTGVDCILHCAARTGVWGSPSVYERVNVRGLKALVDVALAAHVRRIVHVSSVTVHGIDVRGSADETAPLRGGPDPYSRSKVAGELLLQQMIRERGAPVIIVRPGLLYGPRDSGSFGRFAALIEEGKMIMIGSGKNHMPLIYVTDVAQGIVLASEADCPPGREYILVNDEPVTQWDYLSTIASELGVDPPRLRIPARLALGMGFAAEMTGHLLHWKQSPPLTRFGVSVLCGENRFSIERARSELGFVPQVSLAEGVRQGIAWYKGCKQQ
jgi:nucleoside-diphosphate-sugar epimerase